MKKNIAAIMILALAVVLTFTGCAPDKGASVSTKTVRVIGTYGKMDAPASKALSRAAAENMGITSVDSVIVDGKDIKNDLKPVGTPKEGQNNVTFQAEVEVKDTVSFSAEAKDGFVFDAWEVLEIEEDEEKDEKKAVAKADEKLLEEIEDWLDKDGREHKETLTDVPANYIAYLVAEYDHGYHIALDEASKTDKNITVQEFIEKEFTEDELTLVISGSDTAEFTKLMDAITAMKGLEELKLKAAANTTLETVPAISTLEELALSGFTFTADIEINSDKMEYKFEDCTFENLTVTNAKELEIDGKRAKVITIIAAEEVEIENLTADKLDLSQMKSGEVELENNTITEVVKPVENSKVEIEVEKD